VKRTPISNTGEVTGSHPANPILSGKDWPYSTRLTFVIGGSHRLMLEARRGAWWDANKIGLSPPPIETAAGWLVLYHGVRHTPSGTGAEPGVQQLS
jgi:predicted GH43/DUF377 family glycosyl hydrolase